MNYWVLTDTHFGHEILHDVCGRPENFEDRILANTRKYIKPGDVLIHLGDFCIGNDAKWHEIFMVSCAGKKWLIKGNHDRKSTSWYLSHGWDFVGDEIRLHMFGKEIVLSHMPVDVRGIGTINIHGHSHNTRHHPENEVSNHHRLFFIEHGYAPVKLERLIGE